MRYEKIKDILLYLFSLFMSYNFLFYTEIKLIYKLINIALLSIALFIIFKCILKKVYNVICVSNNIIKKREFIIYFLIIFIALLIDFLGNYPFYSHNDLNDSIKQVLTYKYNDWHPFFYTFTMVKIPYLFYKNIASCIVAQYIVIISVLLYFCYFMRKYFLNFKWSSILLTFIVLNPNFLTTSVFITKDVPFAYFMMLGTMFLIEIYLSKGKWLDKKINKFLFIVMCICIGNFRHNGIANYLLMMTLLIIFYKNYRKFLASFFVIYIVISSIVTGPVYKMVGISKHFSPHGEMLGIPFNQFSHLYNSNLYLTNKQLSIMDNLMPLDNWKVHYDINNFNKIKWSKDSIWDYDYSEKHYKEILNMYLELLLKYPAESLKSYVNVTNAIWSANPKNGSFENEWVFNSIKSNSISHKILDHYYKLLDATILNKLILGVGNSLCLILFSFFIISSRYKGDKRKYIPYILVVSNALVIMCLITGREIRFIYSQLFCFYPLILFSLSNFKKKSCKK